MVDYNYYCTDNFKKNYSRLDKSMKVKVKKQIWKIVNNPFVGKPMKNVRKGTREVYVKPYRLSYYVNPNKNLVVLLDFYHKDKQ